MKSSKKVKKFILDNISKHEKDIIQIAINHFGISRQAIHKHMNRLIKENKVIAHGATKGRYYELIPIVNFVKTVNLNSNFNPNSIIKDYVLPHLEFLPKNIFEIFEFSTGVLLNNVKDHSGASSVYYKLFISYQEAHFIINDNGIGIFEHIKSALKLTSNRLAALELAKGQANSDSHKHSGDELNAVINLFDNVKIESSGKLLRFLNSKKEWTIEHSPQIKGSRIHLKIKSSSSRTCSEVFDKIFQIDQNKIRIPLNLLGLSESKIVNPRGKAESVLRNINKYHKVEFDFKSIDLIGPSFANELIRKTKEKNKTVDIKWINTNKTVDLLMSRALGRQA